MDEKPVEDQQPRKKGPSMSPSPLRGEDWIACGFFGPKGERACWAIQEETYAELAKRKGWKLEEDEDAS